MAKRDETDLKAIMGCLTLVGSIVPAVGICLLLMGLIKSFLVDSWLIAIGVGLIVAFPVWGFSIKWVSSRVKKGEELVRERRNAERGILEGGDGEA